MNEPRGYRGHDPKRPDTHVEPGSAPNSTTVPVPSFPGSRDWQPLGLRNPLADAIDRLTLALTVAVPVPQQTFVPQPCPKCGSGGARVIFHDGSRDEFGRKVVRCSRNDHSERTGEHLHVYCQVCHFDWTEASIGAGRAP